MAAGRGRSTRTPLTTPDCSTPSAAVYHLGVSFTAKHLACGTPACPSAGHVNVPKRQINGFRNRDLRQLLFADDSAPPEDQRRHAAAVSRKLALLRAHGLIRKVTGTLQRRKPRTSRVEERRGIAEATRFPSPLIKPDVRISRIRLSDWFHGGLMISPLHVCTDAA
jgi:hypothetical protein